MRYSPRTLAIAARCRIRPRSAHWAVAIIREVQLLAAQDRLRRPDGRQANPRRVARLCIATALTESNLTMYANKWNPESLRRKHDAVGQDHGSVGLYQQQVGGAPNSTADWGTTAQCMEVRHSTRAFVRRVLTHLPDTPDGKACQAVQGSAYPDRYADRVTQARRIVKSGWAYAAALSS